MGTWKELNAEIVGCGKCPRLIEHCRATGADPPRRFRGQNYWARPITGFGDKKASVLIVGLAPAANGANRTGRIFTGDRSGDWLFRALYETGFGNQPTSVDRSDGLQLTGAFVTCAARCAPPLNKLTVDERKNCQPYFLEELRLLKHLEVVVALGGVGWHAYLQARRALNQAVPKPQPKFGHAATHTFSDGITLIGCYHPSQQNTFTGRLTAQMLKKVFQAARKCL